MRLIKAIAEFEALEANLKALGMTARHLSKVHDFAITRRCSNLQTYREALTLLTNGHSPHDVLALILLTGSNHSVFDGRDWEYSIHLLPNCEVFEALKDSFAFAAIKLKVAAGELGDELKNAVTLNKKPATS